MTLADLSLFLDKHPEVYVFALVALFIVGDIVCTVVKSVMRK